MIHSNYNCHHTNPQFSKFTTYVDHMGVHFLVNLKCAMNTLCAHNWKSFDKDLQEQKKEIQNFSLHSLPLHKETVELFKDKDINIVTDQSILSGKFDTIFPNKCLHLVHCCVVKSQTPNK